MNKNILRFCALIFCAAILTPAPAYPDVPDSQKAEVQHLLEFVLTTDCSFERNGKKHTGEEAQKHIKRKYKHFRNKISTTEEFIELSATKSMISGKEYLVYCGTDDPITSRQWLLEELYSFREREGSRSVDK